MPLADLPNSAEATAFRKQLMELIDGVGNALEDDCDTRLCSGAEAPVSRTVAMADGLSQGPPLETEAEAGPCQPASDAADGPHPEFVPLIPRTLTELRVRSSDVEAIILKFLLNSGPHLGFEIARQIRLPLTLISGLLRELKDEQVLVYKGAGSAGDFLYELTDAGAQRARRYWEHCTYYGSVPVDLKDYIASVQAQSVRGQNPKIRDLQRALLGLSIPLEMVVRLAQAVNSGLGLFLYGAPGNGKTTIACRLTRAFGETIWIPRALNVAGSIIRLYDPNNHLPQPLSPQASQSAGDIDERWIRISRPTIVLGGELTLDAFELRTSQTTGVSEAPVQMKSNCGTLVIDDFGRQRATPAEILNRWTVPLSKRYDILHLRNGRKFEFPVDQLIVFSTNLEPRDLVDEAFLRRIPYKIDVGNPSEEEFRKLLKRIARQYGIKYQDGPVDYLIEKCYKSCGREMRYCHPGDIMHQVLTYCHVLGLPQEITNEAIDAAVMNYFSLL